MADEPNHAIIKYNNEAVDTEMVDETSALEVTSFSFNSRAIPFGWIRKN